MKCLSHPGEQGVEVEGRAKEAANGKVNHQLSGSRLHNCGAFLSQPL